MTADMTTFVDIEATPERVWQVLTDLPAYPEWNPFVISAEGTVAVGCRLSLTVELGNALMRRTMDFTVLEVAPPRRLRFRGRLTRWSLPGLLDVERTFTITPRDGGARLWQQSFFRGALVPVITRFVNRESVASRGVMEAALEDRAEGMGDVQGV